MKIWLTKCDWQDLVIQGYKRNKVWLIEKPCKEDGYHQLFASSRWDSWVYAGWKGDMYLEAGKFTKMLDGEHKERMISYIVQQIRSTYKWQEMEWWDWLEQIDRVGCATQSEWYESHDDKDYECYGAFQDACSRAVESVLCIDDNHTRFNWIHEFNLFDVVGVK